MYSNLHAIVHQECTGELRLSLPIIRLAREKPLPHAFAARLERAGTGGSNPLRIFYFQACRLRAKPGGHLIGIGRFWVTPEGQ